MLKKLETTELHRIIKDHIEARTNKRCYDKVPENAESPFYYMELVGKRADNTKTMWREVFSYAIHCIAKPEAGSVGIYEMIDALEESMTDNIVLPEPYWLVLQTNNGLQTLKQDETEEKHAVLIYEFTVCYGFKTK